MARTNDTAPANILERYFPWLAVGFTMFVLVLSSIPPAATSLT